ncbi:hypothetical protein HZS_1452 [Henneguya salminicola]|nr:hypothetical protein HZS_1452 [Henneguya salminicola]
MVDVKVALFMIVNAWMVISEKTTKTAGGMLLRLSTFKQNYEICKFGDTLESIFRILDSIENLLINKAI